MTAIFQTNIFTCIFLNENEWISIKISLKFVPKVRINNIPALVQIIACRQPGDKPLPEPMMTYNFTDTFMNHSASLRVKLQFKQQVSRQKFLIYINYNTFHSEMMAVSGAVVTL